MIESFTIGTAQEDADDARAAVRAVLWRVERGLLSKADAYTVLQVAGLVPDGHTTKRDPNGKRLGPAKESA